MSFFVGLDVSLEETSVYIVDNDGKVVRETKVETETEALQKVLSDHMDDLDRVGVEASSIGIWVHRELQGLGLPMVVVETRHMRSSLSAMRNKTERNDARGIAHMMRLGWFRPVHVKCLENQRLHTLLANRKLLKRKLIDIENHIRGAIRAFGMRVGQVGRKGFEARVRELMEGADFIFETMIFTMLDVRRVVFDGFLSFRSSCTILYAGGLWRFRAWGQLQPCPSRWQWTTRIALPDHARLAPISA